MRTNRADRLYEQEPGEFEGSARLGEVRATLGAVGRGGSGLAGQRG